MDYNGKCHNEYHHITDKRKKKNRVLGVYKGTDLRPGERPLRGTTRARRLQNPEGRAEQREAELEREEGTACRSS